MAKMKVKDLATELNVSNKEICELLTSKGIEVKTGSSNVEDNGISIVRSSFGKKTSNEAKPEVKTEVKTEAKPEAKVEEAPKKKKSIIFVSNPQNSKISGGGQRENAHGNASGNQQNNRNNQNNYNNSRGNYSNNNQGNSRNSNMANKSEPSIYKPQIPKPVVKPVVVDRVEYQGNINKTNTSPKEVLATSDEKPVVSSAQPMEQPRRTENNQSRPQGERTYNNNRPQGNGTYNNNRPQGERTYNNNRPQGNGTYNNNRPQGERGTYNNNRPQGNGGYNNNRPQGNGTYNNNRPQGERGTYNNNRPQGNGGYNNNRPQGGAYNNNRPQGERGSYGNNSQGYNRPQGDRNNNQGYQRNTGDNRNTGYRRPDGGGGYNNDRSGRPGQGDRNNFRKPQTAAKDYGETPIKDVEKHRKEESRRQSQARDTRSRKDKIYEEDAIKLTRQGKAGRFVKPEKRVETVEEVIKVITLPDTLTIKDLADKMKIQPSAIVKKLFLQGKVVTVNQEISFETAEEIAIEYEIMCEHEVKIDVIEELLKEEEENAEEMTNRPPVICVMGHVDHGKTSLLDAIRETNVTDREAGGITQHIGAYTVNVNDQKITFLDTPGHEAFTSMRMRGANATDIAILVVASDDGVMPQTVEAINHAKAAGIEIIVAVNKIDKPNANIDRVKQELAEYELIPEDWGGSTVFAPVSAKTGEGIEGLLEMILLTSEILELKANANRKARGLVIEAELDKGRGPVATILVQKGTLHVGDFVSAGASYGKVRAMIDDKGRRVKEAGPSTPVEILGLSDVPKAGEIVIAHESDKVAKNFADTFVSQNKEKMLEETKVKMSLDDLFTQIQTGNLKELNLIIKADVQGSVEAVKQSLLKISNEEVVVKCIHGGVGTITESDVMLASASKAIIIGFNVKVDANAKATGEREGVDIRRYKVIYQAIEDVELAMKGMLDPIYEEKVIGHAEVRQIFKASAIGNIAGSYVLDGKFERGCKVRISREGEQIFEGELDSLKRFKDDVKEVKTGFECGLVFAGFDSMQELDIVEAYIMVEVPR